MSKSDAHSDELTVSSLSNMPFDLLARRAKRNHKLLQGNYSPEVLSELQHDQKLILAALGRKHEAQRAELEDLCSPNTKTVKDHT